MGGRAQYEKGRMSLRDRARKPCKCDGPQADEPEQRQQQQRRTHADLEELRDAGSQRIDLHIVRMRCMVAEGMMIHPVQGFMPVYAGIAQMQRCVVDSPAVSRHRMTVEMQAHHLRAQHEQRAEQQH